MALDVDAADALVAPVDPEAVLPGFPLTISASSSDVSLSWAATGTGCGGRHDRGRGPGLRRIDGGNGEDTLALVNAGSDLDLAGVYAHRLQGIEIIDATDAGPITISLRALDVGRLSGTSNTLTTLAGDDTIVVAELAGAGFVPSGDGTWSNGVLTLVVEGVVDVSL